MATKAGTGVWVAKRVHKQTWSALANGDDGTWLTGAMLADKTVQVLGTFGAGGSISIEGSNDGGTTAAILNDSRGEGNPVTFTAADIRTILENPERIRPRVTAGDGTTSLSVIIVSESQP